MMPWMVRRFSFVALATMALTLAPQPANATMDMWCGGEGVDAHFEASAGIVSVFYLHAAGRTWASHPDFSAPGAELMFVAGEFDDGEETQTDFVAGRSGEVIATLYQRGAHEGKMGVWAGLMSIKGVGAWLVTCEG